MLLILTYHCTDKPKLSLNISEICWRLAPITLW